MLPRTALAIALALSFISVASAIAPGPPQMFTASASGNTVTLSWQPPITGGVPSNYVIEAALATGGPAAVSVSVFGTGLTVPSVANGIYYLRVRGMNPDGLSEVSNEVALLVPSGGGGGSACTSAPNAPQNFTATAVSSLLSLSWAAAPSGCPATTFTVQAGSSAGNSNIAQANVGPMTSLSASAPSGSYYLRVTAANAFGSSAASNEVTVTVGSTCSTPAAPVLLSPSVSSNTVSLSWLAATGASSYQLEGGSSSGSVNLLNTSTSSTSYNWSSAPAGTLYIRVRGANSCGVGPVSNQVIATVASAPSPAPPSRYRIGATCRDGSQSTATGSGACSSHGGVQCWRYNDGSCTNP